LQLQQVSFNGVPNNCLNKYSIQEVKVQKFYLFIKNFINFYVVVFNTALQILSFSSGVYNLLLIVGQLKVSYNSVCQKHK